MLNREPVIKRIPVVLEFDSIKLTIHPDKLTPRMREHMSDALFASREMHSDLHKFEMKEDESWDTWALRVGKGRDPQEAMRMENTRRHKGESLQAWLAKILRPDTKIHKQGWEILNRMLPRLGITLNENDYWDVIPWDLMQEFIYQFTVACGMEASEFLSPKRSEDLAKDSDHSREEEGTGEGAGELLSEPAFY